MTSKCKLRENENYSLSKVNWMKIPVARTKIYRESESVIRLIVPLQGIIKIILSSLNCPSTSKPWIPTATTLAKTRRHRQVSWRVPTSGRDSQKKEAGRERIGTSMSRMPLLKLMTTRRNWEQRKIIMLVSRSARSGAIWYRPKSHGSRKKSN